LRRTTGTTKDHRRSADVEAFFDELRMAVGITLPHLGTGLRRYDEFAPPRHTLQSRLHRERGDALATCWVRPPD
jgi:hypothetical protein